MTAIKNEKAYWKYLYSFAKSRGLRHEHAEEFAQKTFLKVWEKNKTINLNWAITDFKRSEFGDIRTIAGRNKSNANMEFKESCDYKSHGSSDGSEFENLQIDRYLGHDDLFLFKALFEEGYLCKDLSYYLGLTASRISQKLKTIKGKVANQKIIDDFWEDYCMNEHKSELKIDWIKI